MRFQVTSLNSMASILEDALREYNETYATMDLVLFEDAMKHVSSVGWPQTCWSGRAV